MRVLCTAGLVALLAGLLTSVVIHFSRMNGSPPRHAILPGPGEARPIVLVLGDSLVHASVSDDWVDSLQKRNGGLRFVNAGINGDTTYSIYQRARNDFGPLEGRVDAVLVLIGTNDVLSSTSQEARRFYTWGDKLPVNLTGPLGSTPWKYEHHLAETLKFARRKLGACITAVITPPPFGDGRVPEGQPPSSTCIFGDMERHPNALMPKVAALSRAVARRNGAYAVDLHREIMRRQPALGIAPRFIASCAQMYRQFWNSILANHLAFVDLDTVSAGGDALFTHDLFHLNARGTRLLVELVEAGPLRPLLQGKRCPR